MIDQNSEVGKELQAVVKEELKNYLGKGWNDDVLPLYIVVMLAHRNDQTLVASNLFEFLGGEPAGQFAQWLFEHLAQHPGKYDTPEKAEEAVQDSGTDPKVPVESTEGAGRKRRREKREKIEWKGEENGTPKHKNREGPPKGDSREEKRRKGRDGEVKPEKDPLEGAAGGEPGAERDKDLRRLRRREALGGGDDQSKSRRDERSGRHREERHRHPRDTDPFGKERDDSKKESRGGRERHSGGQASTEKALQPGGRLAGRIGLPGAIQKPSQAASPPSPPREEERASVFNRLNRKGEGEPPGRARMRMDTVPAEMIDDVTVDPTPDPSPPKATPQDVAAELRLIRESLARLQADKAEAQARSRSTLGGGVLPDPSNTLAAANARKAVVHNVHFNATPDILKAHFGGCGSIASAVIDKDFQGNSKGQAIIEFGDEAARKVALTLSGSLLVGRPITVYAKETAPRPNPMGGYRAPMPNFRPRAPAGGRGFGRGAFPGRTTLKNNKYVRPQGTSETPAANGAA